MKKQYHTPDLTNRVKERLMSLTEAENQEELNQELDGLDAQIKAEKRSDLHKSIIGWTTSLAIHATVLMCAMMIAFMVVEDQNIELPPMRVVAMPPVPDKKPEVKHIELMPNVVVVETDTKDPDAKAVDNNLEVPVELTNTSDEDKPSDINKGREDAIADSEKGGVAFLNTMGVGGGASGMFGNRNGDGNRRARLKMGPMGKSASAATEAGLKWLKKHQSANGMWDAVKYFQNCTEDPKCEPGSYGAHGTPEDVNIAMTSYALLAFLGGGHDHKALSKFKPTVAKGIAYLLSIQKPDGMMGNRNYEHPVAAMALIEAYGMTNDPDLRVPAQKAVDMVIDRQTVEKQDDPYSGLLWDYGRQNLARNDISCSGWTIMALKSAAGAGLNVKDSITGAKKALERVWKAANSDWAKKSDPYTDMTVFPYTWNPSTNETKKDHLSFVGSTCAIFLGHTNGDPMLETLLNDAENRWIKSGAYKRNHYASYYLSLSLFQAGGDRWKRCLDTLIPYAVDTQSKADGCLNGSWSSDDQAWVGKDIGRVLATCYNLLNLEVAYRYVQVHPEVKLPKAK